MNCDGFYKNRRKLFLFLACFVGNWILFFVGFGTLGGSELFLWPVYNDSAQVIRRKTPNTTNGIGTTTNSIVSEEDKREEIGKHLCERREHIRAACKKSYDGQRSVEDLRPRLYRNDQYKLLYCGIPKIGSSFWKRLLKVVDQLDHKKLYLFDMPSMSAHHSIPDTMSMRDVSRRFFRFALSTYTSFMFTRDPFYRLFSGYVDKLVLPNEIGVSYGKTIARKRRRKFCPLNVTFEDMTLLVANSIVTGFNLEGHFRPTYDQCEPCNVNFTFIGKMETFMDDTNYILSSVGLTYANLTGKEEEEKSDKMNDKGLIKDLAQRTFTYVDKKPRICLKRKEVLARLWRVYQIRGIISKTDRMPHFDDPDKVSAREFLAASLNVYHNSKSLREERLLQRDEAILEAFSSLSRPLLYRLSQAFSKDCQLYDYDCNAIKRFRKATNVTFPYFNFEFENV